MMSFQRSLIRNFLGFKRPLSSPPSDLDINFKLLQDELKGTDAVCANNELFQLIVGVSQGSSD